MFYYIYILKSKRNNSFYVGSCENIKNRLEQHNNGESSSTKRFIPWELIYSERYNILSEARKREYQIKSWKKRSAIEKLINLGL
jgi:putative endonuclease